MPECDIILKNEIMKKLLVPTDFSQQAENALKVAAQLARKNNSELYILHTLELPLHLANSSDSNSLPEPLYFIKLAEKNFRELLAKPFMEGIDIQEAYGHNEIFEDIKEAVEMNNIDLVVMGSHGVSGFKEMFIGSNTEKVVRTSKKPVLVIKNEYDEFNIKDFVFASDFSKESKGPIQDAIKFAKGVDARLHLLFVNTPSGFCTTSEVTAKMDTILDEVEDVDFTLNIYNDNSVEKGILNFAKASNATLIGMSTHGRKGLSHFFNGSISEDLVNHAKMPVVTFKI
jgi:nucleotide-binding universal stress UspA family protein